MEMETGKLFIGGISWDTNEERLRDYFQTFGEVVEAVIMKDRTTGRARGFGFVVFSDPAVAERVVKEKHMIDGRTVEAKKAVPREDHASLNRSVGSLQGSPGPTRTKKIFVGGLASTVTETDFRNYFDQFGTITDVVVMYDHNTQRPRGFGFITYESEESVDKVLLRTFHELNGKMVEVKRAVPKESSPGPNRGQMSPYNYGLSRVNSFINAYNPSSVGGYGVRVDGRFSPVTVGRAGYPPFSPPSYNVGPNADSALGVNYRGNGIFNSTLGFRRELSPNPMLSVAANRYNTNPIGYGIAGSGSGSGNAGGNPFVVNSPNRNMWGNVSQSFPNNSPNLTSFLAPGNGFDSNGAIWGNPNSRQGVSSGVVGGSSSFIGRDSGFGSGNPYYGNVTENRIGYVRNSGNSFIGVTDDEDIGPTWRSSSPELEMPRLIGYAVGSGASDAIPKNPVGYIGYSTVADRSNRGIAT